MNQEPNVSELVIRRLEGTNEVEECAHLMANSEPWITLGRTYDQSRKILSDDMLEVHVAVNNAGLVGFIILNMHGPFAGYIQTICIAPEWRSQGIGSRLVEFAEQRIFRDRPNVFMCVSSFNKEAQRLYERLGYKVVGEMTDYLVKGHSEILLRKTIGPLMGFSVQSVND
jgi:[ribosomal protein S18]-alanine N-acetyltransferase